MILLPPAIDCTWAPPADLAILRFCLATGKPRNPRFERESRQWLIGRVCACCGCTTGLQTHHIKPFHLFPELEMDPANWLALCGPTELNCHLRIGHLGNFKWYNPRVVELCQILTENRESWKQYGRVLEIAA